MMRKMSKIIEMVQSTPFDTLIESIPSEEIDKYYQEEGITVRVRKYAPQIVFGGMLYQATQEDKSLQHTVLQIAMYQEKQRDAYVEKKEQAEQNKGKRHYAKRGRPKREVPKVQKSFMKPTSLNTASYDDARQRMPAELVRRVFAADAAMEIDTTKQRSWKGHRVYAIDGTKFSTPRTPELEKYFEMSANDANPFPIGRIEGIVNVYTGMVVGIRIGNDKCSELQMLYDMYDTIPSNTIVLGDHLYSSYGHLAHASNKGVQVIAQRKRMRTCEIVKTIGAGDHLVRLSKSVRSKVFESGATVLQNEITVRRITYTNPKKPEHSIELYTTLTDSERYPAQDIAALYQSRWQIELSFREIKSVLSLDHLRSKKVDMVFKEIYTHVLLYNIIRRLMLTEECSESGAFPPSGVPLQINPAVTSLSTGYVDKLGRTYIRHSGGRHPKPAQRESETPTSRKE